MLSWKGLPSLLGTVGLASALAIGAATAATAQDKKYKVYFDLSITGGGWLTAATNAVKALAGTPPYDKMVDLKVVISGTDPQKQISDYESMIADGADAIVSMPISINALNRTVKLGCEKGVLFFNFEQTVTEPCAYNISTVTAHYGENGAQALVNMLHGKGRIFFNHVIPGAMAAERHYHGAQSVFKNYPGIQIVAEYYGSASDEVSQAETAKALAAHPDVDGIMSLPGEWGVLQAVLASGRQNLIPIVGEGSNGFRLALADPELRKRGFQGVSAGGAPATAGYAFKLAMEVLTKQRDRSSLPHNIEYPQPWVPAAAVKVCSGNVFGEDGCNVFPKEKAPPTLFDNVFNPTLLPEITLPSAMDGAPTPGATIQKLPAEVTKADDTPGLNCQPCNPPPDLFRLTLVTGGASPAAAGSCPALQ
jgi:ribose transport system substrate-binding protein